MEKENGEMGWRLEPQRIKIRVMPADTVAQFVERLLFVNLRKVYDRNVVNKHRIYIFLLCVITFNLIDYIYNTM